MGDKMNEIYTKFIIEGFFVPVYKSFRYIASNELGKTAIYKKNKYIIFGMACQYSNIFGIPISQEITLKKIDGGNYKNDIHR